MSDHDFLKLAVIGDPVAHSASPALLREFMAEAGIAGSYEAIRVAAGQGARAILELSEQGYCGLNVTTPLKEEAYRAIGDIGVGSGEIVRATGSVNTIVFDPAGGPDGRPLGCNTDGIGAREAIRAATGAEPRDSGTILVLGAGPTARAAAFELVDGNARVLLWNRTAERAREMAGRFEARLWNGEPVDVVFSALRPGPDLDDDLIETLRSARVVVDANYGPRATLASLLERDVVDGDEMLRASARASFEMWLQPHRRRRGQP
jgi:shikimate dehydrogenase